MRVHKHFAHIGDLMGDNDRLQHRVIPNEPYQILSKFCVIDHGKDLQYCVTAPSPPDATDLNSEFALQFAVDVSK